MPVGFVEWLDGVLKVMKLTELMGNTWKDKGDRTSNRLFAVGNDPFDRDLERLQKLPDAPSARQ